MTCYFGSELSLLHHTACSVWLQSEVAFVWMSGSQRTASNTALCIVHMHRTIRCERALLLLLCV